jgi:PAS domain S-box-containing protein
MAPSSSLARQSDAERLRAAQSALAATEARLSRSQRLGGAHPYELDLATKTLVAGPGLGELYGLQPDEPVTYEAVVGRIHPDDRERARSRHEQAGRFGSAYYEQEYRVLLPDGGIRWVLARGEALKDEMGRAIGLAGVTIDITRLKSTEQALAENERRFGVLADAMPQMIWSTRPDGFHDYYNKRWYEFTGMPEGSTDGEGWSGMFHPEDQERAWAKWHHSLATGEPYDIEYRLRHRSGEYRWVLGRALAIRDEEGRIERWFGTCTDIHDLKETEAALALSEEFTRRVLASSDDCIKVLDLDAKLTFMSEGGKRVMEVDDFSQIQGCDWPDFWTGSTAAEARAAIDAAKQGGTGRFQGFCPTVAGTPRWWDVAVTAILGADGKPEKLLSISRDITKARKAQEELRASEERFRTLVDVSPQVVWFGDATGAITYCNRYWYDYTGLPPGVTSGDGWASVIHPDHRARVLATWKDAASSMSPYEVEIPLRRASDGEYRWFIARGQPLRNERGEVDRWIGIALDIQSRKQAEEARELLARELSHRIKNIFAVVNGLVSLSAKGMAEARPFAESLRGRLHALAQAHEYVRPHSPEDPAQTQAQTALGLLRLLLEAYLQEGRERVILRGDDVEIGERSATALALVLHEQATNAVKYGALSRDSGQILVETCCAEGEFRLTWTERGGPRLSGATPERQGFGAVMASRSISGQLGGQIERNWHPEGLRVVLTVPTANLLR